MNRIRLWVLRLLLGATRKELATLIQNIVNEKLLSSQAKSFSLEQLTTVIQGNVNLSESTKAAILGMLKSDPTRDIYK